MHSLISFTPQLYNGLSPKLDYFGRPAELASKAGFDTMRFDFGSVPVLLLRFFQSNQAIVHLQTSSLPTIIILTFIISFKGKKKLIWTPHTSFGVGNPSDMPFPIYMLAAALFKKLDRIICISEYEQKYFHSLGYSNIAFVPLPFAPYKKKENASKLSNSSQIDLLFVGGDRPVKGIETAMEAFEKLLNMYPKAKMHILGKVAYEKVAKFEKYKSIIFYQHIPHGSAQYCRLFEKCTYFLCNSRYEGTPLALYEAMYFGLACCLPKLDSLYYMCMDSALFHTCGDINRIVQNLTTYIEDPELRSKHVLNNCTYIKSKIIAQFDKSYPLLLEGLIKRYG